MKIGVLLVRHPATRKSPIMPEVVRLLSKSGAVVEPIYLDEQLTSLGDVRVEHDLYVLKSGTELALSLAGALHAAGAAMLNPYPVAVACRDKNVTTRILQMAGVPVPETYVAVDPNHFAPLLDRGPLVLKPYRGSQGDGVRVIRDAAELADIPAGREPMLAQRYHKPDGLDHKVYCIGDEIFGVRRIWPARAYEEKLGEPFSVTGELREIALRAGRAFGLGLYGFDVVISRGRPYVVDFSCFPGFKGVPDAARRLAGYVNEYGRRVLSGETVVS